MNDVIEEMFADFTVNGTEIPVSFLRYEGHGEPYITYMQTDAAETLSADDELIAYNDYYDFDIFSTGNYTEIIKQLKKKLKEKGFVWLPDRSSGDFYETDTGYYHKTLCFAIERMEE